MYPSVITRNTSFIAQHLFVYLYCRSFRSHGLCIDRRPFCSSATTLRLPIARSLACTPNTGAVALDSPRVPHHIQPFQVRLRPPCTLWRFQPPQAEIWFVLKATIHLLLLPSRCLYSPLLGHASTSSGDVGYLTKLIQRACNVLFGVSTGVPAIHGPRCVFPSDKSRRCSTRCGDHVCIRPILRLIFPSAALPGFAWSR